MAQRIQTLFIDDIDGSDAEGTVRFGLDGTAYEIDLNARNAEALRSTLAKYVESGRRIAPGKTGSGRRSAHVRGLFPPARPAASTVDNMAQREYLRLLGHEVKDRGRLPYNLASIPVPPREQWPTGAAPAELSEDEVATRAADAVVAALDEPAEEPAPKVTRTRRSAAAASSEPPAVNGRRPSAARSKGTETPPAPARPARASRARSK